MVWQKVIPGHERLGSYLRANLHWVVSSLFTKVLWSCNVVLKFEELKWGMKLIIMGNYGEVK